jgi:hypothetical protein
MNNNIRSPKFTFQLIPEYSDLHQETTDNRNNNTGDDDSKSSDENREKPDTISGPSPACSSRCQSRRNQKGNKNKLLEEIKRNTKSKIPRISKISNMSRLLRSKFVKKMENLKPKKQGL